MSPLSRLSRSGMFMRMAEAAALRSTCQRNQVGVVITDLAGTSVLSIGYNGNAKGLPNTCDSATPGECGCIHAEANALLKAPFHQGPLVMYTTCSPCPTCAKLIINSAVTTVIWRDPYRNMAAGLRLLELGGIRQEQLSPLKLTEQLELSS